MKKTFQLFTITALLSVFSFNAFSQEFVKGTKMLSFGLGVGDRYLGSGYNMVIPPLQANFDYGITDKLGVGHIGIGGLVGFSANRYSYRNNFFYKDDFEYRYTNFTVAARGTYHFVLDVKGLDLYGGVMLGFNVSSVKTTYPVGYDKNLYYGREFEQKHGGIVSGLFAGARYMFNDKFGVYGELGYTVSLLS
ncbi:MAG TPA: hypothetical protein VF691_10465, partial [Cytophagaceae bacterium]